MEDDARYYLALRMARQRRWTAQGKSTVKHPTLGQVVVPHASNLAALENAAEYWGVSLYDIWHEAKVWQYERGDGPLARPKEFCRKKEGGQG